MAHETREEVAAPQPQSQPEPEREQWYRRQIERDRDVMLALSRALTGSIGREHRLMRLWRWMIDDLRSERREQAALVSGESRDGVAARLMPGVLDLARRIGGRLARIGRRVPRR